MSDRTGELVIIGGERRSEAALLLGMTEVPTILMSGLTEAQEDEIMIRDNTHAGVWDNSKLAEVASKWGSEKVEAWGAPAWGSPEIDEGAVDELFVLAGNKGEKDEKIIVFVPARNREQIGDIKDSLTAALKQWEGCKVL